MLIPSVEILLVQQIWNAQLPYYPELIFAVIPTSGINMTQPSAFKPLYSVLKVELLQSDKQQPTIMDEPVVNTSLVNLPAG